MTKKQTNKNPVALNQMTDCEGSSWKRSTLAQTVAKSWDLSPSKTNNIGISGSRAPRKARYGDKSKMKINKPKMAPMRSKSSSGDKQREDEMLARQPVAFYYVGEQLKMNQMGLLSEFEKNMRIRIIIQSALKIDQKGKQWSPADAGIPTG